MAGITDFIVIPSVGSNVNSGTDYNASPFYTSPAGNWNTSTKTFTPTDGSNPVTAGLTVGTYVSVCTNAATTTGFMGRVTSVANAVNGAIVLSGNGFAGTSPATGTGTMTLRAGGAWKGPNGTDQFPFSLQNLCLLNPDGGGAPVNYTTRINFKAVTYSISTQINGAGQQYMVILEAFTSVVGDHFIGEIGNRAVFDWGTYSTTAGLAFSDMWIFKHFEFVSSATVGTNAIVTSNSQYSIFWNCVFHGGRGAGLVVSGAETVIECEAYNCNKSNSNVYAGIQATSARLYRCLSHDNLGSLNSGFSVQGPAELVECVAAHNGQHGVAFGTTGGTHRIRFCDFYNNGGAGIGFISGAGAGTTLLIENCNFVKNAGGRINLPPTSSAGLWPQGFMFQCGKGFGTMANGTENIGGLLDLNSFFYDTNTTPWADPDNGDFTIVSPTGKNKGRALFVRWGWPGGPYTGSPDVGAVQSVGGGGGKGETGAGKEPMETGRITKIEYKDRDITELVRRARRASEMVENLTIVGDGVAGNPRQGFSVDPV